MEENEKRRTTRLPVPVYVEAFTESFPVGMLKNVSEEGIFVQSTEPKEVGTRMDLSFKLPGSDTKIQVTAEVVWVVYPPSFPEMEPHGRTGRPISYNPGMGLRILSSSAPDLDSLGAILEGSDPASRGSRSSP